MALGRTGLNITGICDLCVAVTSSALYSFTHCEDTSCSVSCQGFSSKEDPVIKASQKIGRNSFSSMIRTHCSSRQPNSVMPSLKERSPESKEAFLLNLPADLQRNHQDVVK